jgi:hypothetical protein
MPQNDSSSERDRLYAALAEIIHPSGLPAWLKTPNPAFDGLKPTEVIDRGQVDRLWEMVYRLRAGEPA